MGLFGSDSSSTAYQTTNNTTTTTTTTQTSMGDVGLTGDAAVALQGINGQTAVEMTKVAGETLQQGIGATADVFSNLTSAFNNLGLFNSQNISEITSEAGQINQGLAQGIVEANKDLTAAGTSQINTIGGVFSNLFSGLMNGFGNLLQTESVGMSNLVESTERSIGNVMTGAVNVASPAAAAQQTVQLQTKALTQVLIVAAVVTGLAMTVKFYRRAK